MIKKKITIPIYFGSLILIKTNNLKKLEKKYDLHISEGLSACSFRCFKKNGYSRYGIAFDFHNERIIAHESLHIVNMIFEDRDVRIDTFNDEPQCYLLGWVVNECHEFLKKAQ